MDNASTAANDTASAPQIAGPAWCADCGREASEAHFAHTGHREVKEY